MEKEAESAAATAEAMAAREKAQRESSRGSMLAAELQLKVDDTEQMLRKHQLRRMKMLVRSPSPSLGRLSSTSIDTMLYIP